MNRLLMILLKNITKLPGAYAKLCKYAKDPEKYTRQEMWDHIQYVMGLAAGSANVDLQVTGLDNIPKEGSFMLYGNHQGLFDVVAIAASCPRPLSVVYKKELSNVPVLKQIYACTNSFAMDREDVRQSLTVIQNVTRELKSGYPYVIFPEGTRSKLGNKMLPFHAGSFRCAVKAKCPVVPMAFVNSFRVLDEKGSDRVAVQLHYLPQIPYEEFQDMKAAELAQLVQSKIQAVIEENT